MSWKGPGKRLGISVGAGMVVAFLAAIILAIADIYLTGHGHRSVTKPWIDLAGVGIHLSIGDVVLLTVAGLTIALTFRALGREP